MKNTVKFIIDNDEGVDPYGKAQTSMANIYKYTYIYICLLKVFNWLKLIFLFINGMDVK